MNIAPASVQKRGVLKWGIKSSLSFITETQMLQGKHRG